MAKRQCSTCKWVTFPTRGRLKASTCMWPDPGRIPVSIAINRSGFLDISAIIRHGVWPTDSGCPVWEGKNA